MLIFAFLATLLFVRVHGHVLAELRSLGSLLPLAGATPALRTSVKYTLLIRRNLA
jgi:hypothetical protein